MTTAAPVTSPVDLFSDETLKNTEAVFAELRELAPVVYLPANDCWAITRYEDVRNALGDPAPSPPRRSRSTRR